MTATTLTGTARSAVRPSSAWRFWHRILSALDAHGAVTEHEMRRCQDEIRRYRRLMQAGVAAGSDRG
jgi:hypothetical protein